MSTKSYQVSFRTTADVGDAIEAISELTARSQSAVVDALLRLVIFGPDALGVFAPALMRAIADALES